MKAAAQAHGEPAHGWTVVLRRQPVHLVEGRPEGGYTDAYELICCDCGDDPDLDYRDVSPDLQRIRGPYKFSAGIAAYGQHVRLRHTQQPGPNGRQQDEPADDARERLAELLATGRYALLLPGSLSSPQQMPGQARPEAPWPDLQTPPTSPPAAW